MDDAHVIFLDRSLGRHAVAQALLACGARVETHDNHFPMDATDEEWLAEVGARGWTCVTKDIGIRKRTLQRRAVAACGVRLFVFMSGGLTGTEMGQSIAAALPRMMRVIDENNAPFIGKVYRNGKVALWRDSVMLLAEVGASGETNPSD